MKITSTMNVQELNDRTQNALDDQQAEKLRDLLVDAGYETTEDVPESEWLKLLEAAAE